jgi:hypothetical protein
MRRRRMLWDTGVLENILMQELKIGWQPYEDRYVAFIDRIPEAACAIAEEIAQGVLFDQQAEAYRTRRAGSLALDWLMFTPTTYLPNLGLGVLEGRKHVRVIVREEEPQ